MKFRIAGLAVLVLGWVVLASAQAPVRIQISGGLVTLHAENVPVQSSSSPAVTWLPTPTGIC